MPALHPQRREEHTDPHIVAGYRDPAGLEPGFRPDGRRDFRRLVHRLSLPHDRQGSYGCAKPVWHCPVRAAPEDRMLSDAEWAQIARDIVARTGLSPHGQDDQGVRWIAVRHGPDHIHLVANARPPGRRPGQHLEHPVPGPRCVHRRRTALRAEVYRPSRPHRRSVRDPR